MSVHIPNIGAPANRALEKANITSLEQLANIDEQSLLALHGVGPKAVEILKEAMQEEKLSLLKEPLHAFPTDFIVFGDLKCDNAPKRRVIRDYLILLYMKDKDQLSKVVNEHARLKQMKLGETEGLDSLLKNLPAGDGSISSLEITQILSHGKEGAAHGVVTYASGHQEYFAEFYVFESHKKEARIQTITRYLVGS